MEYQIIYGILFLLILLGLLFFNSDILMNQKETYKNYNYFSNDECCCNQDSIDKCNAWGKSCVCDYFDKNKHFCQAYY